MNVAVGLMDGLGLDGDRCIRVIPRHTQPPIHPPIGGGVSTNHKSSNRIELSRLSPDLFNF